MAATMLSCIFTMLFAIQYRMDLIPKGRTLTTKELFADKFHLIAIHRQKVLANTAQRYLNEGNPSSAFALLERADSMGEDRDVITILGNAYRAIGDSAKAEEEELRLKRFLAKGYDSQVVFGRTAH
jgi:hypothetical protein